MERALFKKFVFLHRVLGLDFKPNARILTSIGTSLCNSPNQLSLNLNQNSYTGIRGEEKTGINWFWLQVEGESCISARDDSSNSF